MKKRLSTYGNSRALIIDKPILDLLNITESTDLEITTDGKSLILTPTQNSAKKSLGKIYEDKKLQKIAEKTNEDLAAVLKRLAKS